jgi:hypothetical protein
VRFRPEASKEILEEFELLFLAELHIDVSLAVWSFLPVLQESEGLFVLFLISKFVLS